MKQLSILVLDDEKRIIREVSEFLENKGYLVHTADRPSAAFSLLQLSPVDIALIDIKLPEYSGLDFLRRLREQSPATESIMMSGHGDMDFELHAAIERIRRFLEAQNSTRRYAMLCEELNRELIGNEELIGASPAIEIVRESIATAATHADTPVLIYGESGTGKELVARRIHALSARSSGRFVAVNCAAVPPEMFESEFFGHTRGAFTDARASRDGLFKTASGGTLFLDEVAEIPLHLQAKLLRVIEDGKLRPVGSDTETQVNARVVCATNKNLLDEVKAGRFRRDLYYRLAVYETFIPPLRERSEDIGLLADFFYSRFSRPHGSSPQSLSARLIERLNFYMFPGNVRELKNLVERISILGRDPTEKELYAWLDLSSGMDQTLPAGQTALNTLNLGEIEEETIKQALERTRGNNSAAAVLLGISRQALERRLFRHKMKQS